MGLVLVFVGGSVGAVARFLVSGWIGQRTGGSFPFGTMTINVVGSFLIGILLSTHLGKSALLLCDVGFTGAFTTFSTFSYESVQLWEQDLLRLVMAYQVGSLALGFLGVSAGFWLGGRVL